jgi:hypothetical protein
VLLDEGLESALGAVLEYEVIEVAFLNDAIALDDVGVVQLLMDLDLLLQQHQILLLLPYLPLIHHLDCEELPLVCCEIAEVNSARVPYSQKILLLIFVLFYLDAALAASWSQTLRQIETHRLREIQDLWGICFTFPVIFPWKIHLLSIL